MIEFNNMYIKETFLETILETNLLKEVISSKEEVDFFLKIAYYHNLIPYFFYEIKNSNTSDKSYLYKEFQKIYKEISFFNIRLTQELLEFEKLSKSLNISIIPFKGLILSQFLYKNITKRQFGDIDIFIKKKDFRAFSNRLMKLGYTPYYEIEKMSDKTLFLLHNDCPFWHKEKKIMVEIHWRFFKNLALNEKIIYPFNNLKKISLYKESFYSFSNEINLLYLTLHGTKHFWERIGWILDIDSFIRVANIDWQNFILMAKKMGALKMSLLGFYLSLKYFKTPLPKEIKELIKDKTVIKIAKDIEKSYFEQKEPYNILIKFYYMLKLRDSLYYKVAMTISFLFSPNKNEARLILLSDRFYWLYWIIRPFGSLIRFINSKILRRKNGK